jgi:transcriptional regulator with XRE-family HTH domain
MNTKTIDKSEIDKNLQTMGDRIKYAMMKRGMSQTELGDAIGKKPQTIQRIIVHGGKSTLTVKIAKALQVRAEWLEDGIGPMDLPVEHEFLDKMSALSIENRVIIETLVESLTYHYEDELLNKINRLGDDDSRIIRMMVDKIMENKIEDKKKCG